MSVFLLGKALFSIYAFSLSYFIINLFFSYHIQFKLFILKKKKSMLGPGSVQKITTFLNEFLKKKFTVKIDQLVLIFDNFNFQILEFF